VKVLPLRKSSGYLSALFSCYTRRLPGFVVSAEGSCLRLEMVTAGISRTNAAGHNLTLGPLSDCRRSSIFRIAVTRACDCSAETSLSQPCRFNYDQCYRSDTTGHIESEQSALDGQYAVGGNSLYARKQCCASIDNCKVWSVGKALVENNHFLAVDGQQLDNAGYP